MITVILIGHATVPAAFLEAAEMILGPQLGVHALNLRHDTNTEQFRSAIMDIARDAEDAAETLILADLFGGSPANTASSLLSSKVRVVTGLNLPMLLEVLINRENCSLTELTQLASDTGIDAIIDLMSIVEQGE